ncbi:MAG: 4-(cytidine 5'-diphospho)-2-C-methyl-D-erythritol kinase [Gemmatimonadaceae bacterium]
MRAASVRAQAKVNLVLHVTGRDAAGYHTLETLFCRLEFADVVTVRLTAGERSLLCSGPAVAAQGLGPDVQNLAWRAADAYTTAAGWPRGFAIDCEKHIPVGGGLGGGSADAGGVLRCLNALNPRPLAAAELDRVAVSLGADVPFVTQERSTLAWAHGRGELWTALVPLPAAACLVIVAPFGIATGDAYAWLDAARGWSQPVSLGRHPEAPAADSWKSVAAGAHNDFETVVFPRFADVAATWRCLAGLAARSGEGAFARLSGSGASVYAVAPDAAAVPESNLPFPEGFRPVATRTASRVEPVHLTD